MPIAWGSVLAAAIPAVGGLVGNMMSQQGQQQTNVMNQQEILQEEQWQTQMSDTAMQRRVQDLQAAGLNPMLAIGQGGASVPGVGMIPMQNPLSSMTNIGGQMQGAVSTGLQVAQTQASVDLAKAQANKANAEAGNVSNVGQNLQADTAYKNAQKDFLNGAQTQNVIAATGKTLQDTNLSVAQQSQVFAQIDKIRHELVNIDSSTNQNVVNAQIGEVTRDLQGLEFEQKQAIYPFIRTMMSNDALRSDLGMPASQNASSFERSFWGQIVRSIGLEPSQMASSAVDAARLMK